MRRYYYVLLCLLVLLCGCAKGEATKVSSTPLAVGTTVMGRVSAVSGNDFTLLTGGYSSKGKGEVGLEDAARPDANAIPPKGDSPTLESNGGSGSRPIGSRPSGIGSSGSTSGGPSGEGRESGTTGQFVEDGQELKVRIAVGTPITYGNLSVDFSQIQTDYIITLTYASTSDGTEKIVSGEIVSTT